MDISTIEVPSTPGVLSVNVCCPKTPHSVAGIIKRYLPDRTPEGEVGQFLPSSPTVQIGSLAALADHFFVVKGAVIALHDNPPTRFEVQVAVLLGGQVIHAEVPVDGGTGTVGDDDHAFIYKLRIVSAS